MRNIFGVEIDGPLIPFAAQVGYEPMFFERRVTGASIRQQDELTPHLFVRAHTHIVLVRALHVMTARVAQGPLGSRLSSVARFSKKCHRSIMSLLGVPDVSHFPMVTSSSTCSPSRPSASSTPLAGTRSPPCVSAQWSGMSGCIANPTADTR